MAFVRRILAGLCILMLLISLGVPAFAAETPDTQDLVQQMLNYYYHYQAGGKTDIYRLLDQLRQFDSEKADLWQGIFEYWFYAADEMPKNETVLPDDLPQDDSLCIVVLGYALTPYGGMMPELVGRLELALEAAEKYPNAYILCCGGGTASQALDVTEARQMSKWLREHGIDRERIIIEDYSVHTVQNADFGIDILIGRYPQVQQLAVITSDYHLTRSTTIFFAKAAHAALENGTQPLSIVACLGYEAGYEGRSEDPLDQTAHVARVCGFEFERADKPQRSQLTDIDVNCDTLLEPGMIPHLTVTAKYDTGFSQDVTAECRLSGYDPENLRTQFLTVTYTEGSVQIQAVTEIRRPVSVPDPTVTEPTEALPAMEPFASAPEESPLPSWTFLVIGAAAVVTLFILRRKK